MPAPDILLLGMRLLWRCRLMQILLSRIGRRFTRTSSWLRAGCSGLCPAGTLHGSTVFRRALIIVFAAAAIGGAQERSTFDFRSDFWVNLHHFLYEQASAKEPQSSDSAEWNAAVEYYRRELSKRDLLRDEGMVRIHDALPDLDAVPPELAAQLRRAAPVYRARWWEAQNRANLQWIHDVEPLVARYGDGLKQQLAQVYQTPWPSAAIRTDVCPYATFAGAYTTIDPVHITISSANAENAGTAALEILFHEASHGLVRKVSEALSAEASAQKKLFQRRAFWHAVLFFTAGELVRQRAENYTPYAIRNGTYDRAWPGALPVLQKDWQPYLDGKIDLAPAVRRLVQDYGVPQ